MFAPPSSTPCTLLYTYSHVIVSALAASSICVVVLVIHCPSVPAYERSDEASPSMNDLSDSPAAKFPARSAKERTPALHAVVSSVALATCGPSPALLREGVIME